MPLILNTHCKTCGTEPPPAGARFCRTCGRRYGWAERAGGLGVGVGAVVVVAVGAVLLVVGLVVVALVRSTGPVRPTPVAVRPVPPVRSAMPFPAFPQVPALPMVPHPLRVPPVPPIRLPVPQPSFPRGRPSAVPTRAGDVDLTADPLALYAGGPSADRLTVHGLRLGLPVRDVPPALLAGPASVDHLRDVGGNLYAVDDDRISEVHLLAPDVLTRWPIDGAHALLARLGEPDTVYDDADGRRTYVYADRGVHVRWDTADERIVEVVLVRPARGVGSPLPSP